MLNLLITGADGQLGNEIKRLNYNFKNYNFYFADKRVLDVTNLNMVENFCKTNNINFIINSAAYTKVDECEHNYEYANLINNIAVKNLARIALQNEIGLIHISTDYVFSGENFKPYKPNDDADPKNIYGKTKLAGERQLISLNPKNSLIIRTSWLYSSFNHNFLKTILRSSKEKKELNVIADQIGTPTYANDLAQAILEILPKIQNKDVLIYHYSNEGVASWYDFARQILSFTNSKCEINPIASDQYETKTPRPYYSILDKSDIKNDFGLKIPHWQSSLKKCLKDVGYEI